MLQRIARPVSGLTAVAILSQAPALAGDALPSPEILSALDVGSATLQELAVVPAGETLAVEVTLGGQAERVVLWPHSLRSPHYQLLVQGADGALVETEPSPVVTYRGTVEGHPESVVAATWRDGALSALLRLAPEADVWTVQPAAEVDAGAPPGQYVVFTDADGLPTGGTCATDTAGFEIRPGSGAGGLVAGTAEPLTCEIACDTDVQFYNQNGSSVSGTENDIESIMNGVEAIFLADVNIEYEITTIIVRTAEPDPYSETDANHILNELRSEWVGPQAGVHRDVAHLFTGKNMDGSTIGIAWLGTICEKNQGYGVSQSKFSGNYNSRVALTAHELGHNFSASHCNGNPNCFIMCSGLGGCDGVTTAFANAAKNVISGWASLQDCLVEPDPPMVPVLSAVVPPQVPALVPGTATHFSLMGDHLDDVADVIIDGQSLGSSFPPSYTVVSPTQIDIDLPLLDTLGTVDVTVTNLTGADTTSFEVVAPSPPALQLGAGGDPEPLLSFLPLDLTSGGQPGNVMFLWASFTLAPSIIPGTLTLDIGNGFLDLYLVAFPVVEPQGWVTLSISGANLPNGTTVHFQAFEYDPITGSIPVESTGVATGLWLL